MERAEIAAGHDSALGRPCPEATFANTLVASLIHDVTDEECRRLFGEPPPTSIAQLSDA